MDNNFRWRFGSRLVAIFDLIVSTLLLAFLVLYLFVTIHATTQLSDIKESDPDPDLRNSAGAVLILLWILTGVLAIVIFLILWASIMLLKATREGADPAQALHRARIWRKVVILFLVINVIYRIMNGSYGMLVFTLLFRGILLFVVWNFITELQQATSYNVPPVAVVVKH